MITSHHIPQVSKKALQALKTEREAYAAHWRGAAMSKLEAVREASTQLLRSMLQEAAPEAEPKIASDVVDRYAGLSARQHNQF